LLLDDLDTHSTKSDPARHRIINEEMDDSPSFRGETISPGARTSTAAPMRAAPMTSLLMITQGNRNWLGRERKRTNTLGRITLRMPNPVNAQPTTATITDMSSSSPPSRSCRC
jgi:hypothetical protein